MRSTSSGSCYPDIKVCDLVRSSVLMVEFGAGRRAMRSVA